MSLRPILPLALAALLPLACTVGDASAPAGGNPSGADAGNGGGGGATWVPITDSAMGTVTGTSFELDADGNIVAIVDGKVSQWDAGSGSWVLVAEPPAGATLLQIRVKNGALFAMLQTANGKQVCEYINNTWEPRTLIGPTYASGFSVHGADKNIMAVIEDAGGTRQICQCDLVGCTPMTPLANISPTDFDCNGCGGGGGGGGAAGQAVYYAQLDAKVCSSTGNADWVPETVDAPGLGPSIIAEDGALYVEISDEVCQWDAADQEFVSLTGAFPNMIDFKMRGGVWIGLADGVVCEYK